MENMEQMRQNCQKFLENPRKYSITWKKYKQMERGETANSSSSPVSRSFLFFSPSGNFDIWNVSILFILNFPFISYIGYCSMYIKDFKKEYI